MRNILDEYLVKLGAVVDTAGFNKFHQTLRDAEAAVDKNVGKMLAGGAQAAVGITSTFAAMGTAVLGFIDKIAQADQEYRLFALHMFMSKDRAQALKITLDSLGVSLGEATWDPELNRRAVQLMEDQRKMIQTLGPDYEANMRKVRDVRFEVTRLEVELKYLGMSVVNEFLKLIGPGIDKILVGLRSFNNWFQLHLPEISKWLATNFIPIWKDLEQVFTHSGRALESLGVAFTNVVGLFTGDKSIMGSTFDFQKLADAVKDVVHWFAILDETLSDLIDLFAHLVSAAALAVTGNFKAAGEELKAAVKDINAKTVMGTVMVGTALVAPELVPEEAELAEGGTASLGVGARAFNAITAYARKHWLMNMGIGANIGARMDQGTDSGSMTAANGPLRMTDIPTIDAKTFANLSKATSGVVPPELIAAITQIESGGNLQAQAKGSSAYGPMQLTAATAKQYGVNRFDPTQNMEGGTAYLRDLLNMYHGDLTKSIGAYSVGPGEMNEIMAGKATGHKQQAMDEISHVLSLMGKQGSVQVGSVTIEIHPPKGVSEEAIAREVKNKFDSKLDKAAQRNMLEFNSLGYGYGGN